MISVLSIARSGMLAATRRVSVRSAVAAPSEGPPPAVDPASTADFPAAYIAQRVKQAETVEGGTIGNVMNFLPGYVLTYDRTSPFADESGIVSEPYVSFAGESVQQAAQRYGLMATARVRRRTSLLLQSLLDIKA